MSITNLTQNVHHHPDALQVRNIFANADTFLANEEKKPARNVSRARQDGGARYKARIKKRIYAQVMHISYAR